MSARDPNGTLQELAPGAFAYLQRGSWGFSNAGLITDGDASLLVDTLYDLRLTAHMLEQMRRASAAAEQIDTLVNTHANGDHCWGNQLVTGARMISSRATAHELLELSPGLMATLVGAARAISHLGPRAAALLGLLGRLGVPRVAALGESADFVVECFGAFDFRGIQLTVPTHTFDGRLTLTVGSKPVELLEVGPAHTRGDTMVYSPRDRVVFSGDILFAQSHPVIWAGPVGNWIDACDRLLALDVDVIVPGHGPLTDKAGVQATKLYLQRLLELARAGREAGAAVEDVARQALACGYEHWGEAHRVVANIDTIYRELAGDHSPRDPLELFALMSRLERSRPSRKA